MYINKNLVMKQFKDFSFLLQHNGNNILNNYTNEWKFSEIHDIAFPEMAIET